MKKSLLTIFAFIVCVGSQAQNASRLPQGFRKAEIPASAKSKKITVDVRESNKDAGTPFNKTINSRLTNPQTSTPTLGGSFIDEYLVGYSFYDLQTNNAISNRIVHNDDGSYRSHGPTRLIMMRQKPFLIVEPDTIIRRMEFRGYTHMYRGHHKDQEHGLRIFAQDLPIS